MRFCLGVSGRPAAFRRRHSRSSRPFFDIGQVYNQSRVNDGHDAGESRSAHQAGAGGHVRRRTGRGCSVRCRRLRVRSRWIWGYRPWDTDGCARDCRDIADSDDAAKRDGDCDTNADTDTDSDVHVETDSHTDAYRQSDAHANYSSGHRAVRSVRQYVSGRNCGRNTGTDPGSGWYVRRQRVVDYYKCDIAGGQ